ERVTTRDGDRYGCYVGAWTGGQSLEEAIAVAAAARGIAAHLSAGIAADPPPGADRASHRERLRELLRGHYRHADERPRAARPDMMVRTAIADLLPGDADWLVVDTACSSSLYAIDLGVKNLLAGDRDIAFCGGAGTLDRPIG